MAKTQNDRAVIDLVINGQQSKTSLKEVTLEATRARSALLKMKEADDPAAYAQKLKDYRALSAAQKEITARINDTTTAWSRFKANAASTMAGVVGGNIITTALSAAVSAVPQLIGKYREFNAASQELSAVTGATGKDLEYLNETAQKTGPGFGKSAAEMLEAYKLMASAKPELLANKELLTQTTEAAITLAQAGKIDLAEATTVTAESLNQFGESADQANRYINVIAAGAKEGSAEINEMGAALKNSGTVAASQNVSFEQTNAVLQSLSTIALKGGEAGTTFRNVLLTLGSGANDTNPKVVGLQRALENLGKKNMSTAEMTKLFGKENIIAAQHIITHRDQIAELTKKVTGTQEAFTQAATNNATLDHQLAVFWARVEGLSVAIGAKLVPAFTSLISGATGALDVLPQVGQWIKKNGEWLLLTAVPGLIAYHGAMIKATLATAASTVAETYRSAAFRISYGWLVITETATKLYAFTTGVLTGQISLQSAVVTVARTIWAGFNAILLANPIGIVIGAMGGLIAAMKYFSEHTERALDVERKKQSLQQQSKLYTELNARAQKDLNEKIAGYNQLSKAEQAELKKTIALKETEAKMRLANAYARAREIAREAAEPSFWDGAKQGASDLLTGNWDNLTGPGLDKQKAQQAEANKAQAYAEAKQLSNTEQLKKDWEQIRDMRLNLDKPDTKPGSSGGSTGLTDEQKKAAEKRKRDAKHDAEELEKLLADARMDALKAEQSDYDKAVFAFAEKYTKMYDLAHNNTKKIKEIETLSLIEMAAITKAASAKEAEEQRKRELDHLKDITEQADKELVLKRDLALRDIKTAVATPGSGVSKDKGKELALEVEQQYLLAKEMMYVAHYEAMANAAWGNDELLTSITQDMATKITGIHQEQVETEGKQAEARAETRQNLTERLNKYAENQANFEKQMAEQLYSVLSTNWTNTLEGYKNFWKQSSILQKAALIAQKAWALAEIAINLSRQISADLTGAAIYNALVPGAGFAFGAKQIAMHTGQAALQAAAVMSVNIPAFADGGYTGAGSAPGGFVASPTLFSMGRRSFVGGEAGTEFMISNRALQNPVVADFTRMLDVAQKTGNFSQFMSGQSGGSQATPAGGGSPAGSSEMNNQLLVQLIEEQQLTRQVMKEYASRPILQNMRLRDQYDANVQEARDSNKL